MVDRKKTRVTVKSVLSAWGHVCFSGSQLGAILPPGDTGKCLEAFLVITAGWSGEHSDWLLNISQSTYQIPHQRITSPQC